MLTLLDVLWFRRRLNGWENKTFVLSSSCRFF